MTIAEPAPHEGRGSPSGRPVEYCLITAGFPRTDGSNRSGWGTYAETVVRCLRDADVRVTIVLMEDDDNISERDAFDDPTIVRVRLPFVRYASLVAPGFVEGLRLLRAVRRLDRDRHFDVIEGPNVLGLCWAVATRFRARFILRAHTSLTSLPARPGRVQRWRHAFRSWLDAATARRARLVVTHSRAHAATVITEYGVSERRIVIVPHAIRDPGRSVPGDPNRILAIANAVPRKGVDVLLRAFVGLHRRHPQARLVVVGCTEADVHQLLGSSEDAGDVGRSVSALGQLSDLALEDEWDRAGIVVVPSRYESFGLVAAEAMARGKVVVATNGGALGDVVGSGGMVVPVEDVEALEAALEEVVTSEESRARLAAAGRARYEALYRPALLAERLMALIASLHQPARQHRAE